MLIGKKDEKEKKNSSMLFAKNSNGIHRQIIKGSTKDTINVGKIRFIVLCLKVFVEVFICSLVANTY